MLPCVQTARLNSAISAMPAAAASVAHNADIHGVDLPDLLRVDVDLNQLGRRDGERELGVPR